jgi:DNA polymerase III gamma/tau subunit
MQYGSKKISKLQYGSKNIIAAYWGSKKVWELVNITPEQDIDTILNSIISGKELDNMNKLLSNIESSNQDFTDINK